MPCGGNVVACILLQRHQLHRRNFLLHHYVANRILRNIPILQKHRKAEHY